jgi:NAD(P)-dependent dehydrogenase (short-subunit alcohol dehydrogenase family)
MGFEIRLNKLTVLITGASKGIGEAIGVACASAGARVVVSSRKPEALEETVARIKQQTGSTEIHALNCDMGKMDEVRALPAKVVELTGGLDVVVNNAATNPVFGPSLQCSEAAFDKIMAVNVKGPFELAKAAYPYLIKSDNPSVLNISSVGGLSPEPFLGIYSVSKAALLSLTKVLAKEWGSDGVRVNTICPGLIQTKFSQPLWSNEEIRKHVTQNLPISRIGQPEEIAGLCAFLASSHAKYITGSTYIIDGGHSI